MKRIRILPSSQTPEICKSKMRVLWSKSPVSQDAHKSPLCTTHPSHTSPSSWHLFSHVKGSNTHELNVEWRRLPYGPRLHPHNKEHIKVSTLWKTHSFKRQEKKVKKVFSFFGPRTGWDDILTFRSTAATWLLDAVSRRYPLSGWKRLKAPELSEGMLITTCLTGYAHARSVLRSCAFRIVTLCVRTNPQEAAASCWQLMPLGTPVIPTI